MDGISAEKSKRKDILEGEIKYLEAKSEKIDEEIAELSEKMEADMYREYCLYTRLGDTEYELGIQKVDELLSVTE